jgi:hypothetical protein
MAANMDAGGLLAAGPSQGERPLGGGTPTASFGGIMLAAGPSQGERPLGGGTPKASFGGITNFRTPC